MALSLMTSIVEKDLKRGGSIVSRVMIDGGGYRLIHNEVQAGGSDQSTVDNQLATLLCSYCVSDNFLP